MSYPAAGPAEEWPLGEPSAAAEAIADVVVEAASEVHRHLGPGHAKGIYENALCHELSLRAVICRRQVVVPVRYKGLPVGEGRADLLMSGLLLVEIEALPALSIVHHAQVLAYLRAMRLELGLLINFGDRDLASGCRRVVLAARAPHRPGVAR